MFHYLTRNKVGFVNPDEVDVELANQLVDQPRIPIIKSGIWIPSRFGDFIKCKQWRVLDGNFRFLFDGRLMFGPGTIFLWMFMILHIISSLIVFTLFETKNYNDWKCFDWIIISTVIIASLGSIYNILQTVFTEPGCVPKTNEEQRLHNLVQFHFQKQPGAKNIEQSMMFNGKEQICTFCDKCCQFKPKRTIHCDFCGFCIDRKLHHCSIFGVCLGRRNFRYCFRFLFFVNILFATTLTISIQNLVSLSKQLGFKEAVQLSPTTFVLAVGLICPPIGIIQMLILFIQSFFLTLVDKTYTECVGEKCCAGNQFQVLKKIRCIFNIFWMMQNFYQLILARPPESLLKPRSYIIVRASPRSPTVPKKSPKGFQFWACGLTSSSADAPASTLLTSFRPGSARNTRVTRGATSRTSSSSNPNPLLGAGSPKTRCVYTLPSCPKPKRRKNKKSRFEALHRQVVIHYPTPRMEVFPSSNNEPTEGAGQIVQPQLPQYQQPIAATQFWNTSNPQDQSNS